MKSQKTKDWYRKYLQTDHWMSLRAAKLESCGDKCEVCGTKTKLEVHHLRYDPYQERLTDLQILCEDHHYLIHTAELSSKFTPLTAPKVASFQQNEAEKHKRWLALRSVGRAEEEKQRTYTKHRRSARMREFAGIILKQPVALQARYEAKCR